MAVHQARQIRDQDAIALSLVQIGNLYVNTERPAEAEEALGAALAILETLNDTAGLAEAMDLLGVVADLQRAAFTMFC